MVRPHPAVWRVIHGTVIIYLLVLVFLLFQNVGDARQMLRVRPGQLVWWLKSAVKVEQEQARLVWRQAWCGSCLTHSCTLLGMDLKEHAYNVARWL